MDHNQYVNFLLTFSALVRGDPEAANEYFTKAVEQAQRLQAQRLGTATLWLGQLVAQLKGDYELASQINRRGLELLERDPRVLMLRTLLELELGNVEEVKVFMGRLLQAMRSTPASPSWEYAFPAIAISMMARISGTSDMLDTAEEAAQTVLAYSQCTPLIAQAARIGLAMLAVVREDAPAGNEQYLAMSANSDQIGTLPIIVDRVLGLLCHLTDQLNKGAAHFEDSLTFCRKAGYRPELAWTCCDYADTLLRRNNPGDGERATSLLDESLAISTELGMRPLMERVQSRVDHLGSAPTMAPAYPDRLSEREVQVLRLIAAGKTNRDIAKELIITPRTVANHVTNILNKTNVANRTEAATYASQHQLV